MADKDKQYKYRQEIQQVCMQPFLISSAASFHARGKLLS
jgi:hypothetical protein